MEPSITMLLFPQFTSLRKMVMERHAPKDFYDNLFVTELLFHGPHCSSNQDGFGNVLCSLSVLNPLTLSFICESQPHSLQESP